MVHHRPATRTYSQIVSDFEKTDARDARIRAFFEPTSNGGATRALATRKHRYSHVLDTSDDIRAIVNVDKHDGGAREAGTQPAAAPGHAASGATGAAASVLSVSSIRALAAALNGAVEAAANMQLSPPPASTPSSRLAERLLRATQAPLPAPSAAALAGTSSRAASAAAAPHAWAADPPSPTYAASVASSAPFAHATSPKGGRTSPQLHRTITASPGGGELLSGTARLMYFGSTQPRTRRSPVPRSGGGGGGSVRSSSAAASLRRPMSAPAPSPYAAPQRPASPGAGSTAPASSLRASLHAWSPAGGAPSAFGVRASTGRPMSAFPLSSSPYAPSVRSGTSAIPPRRPASSSGPPPGSPAASSRAAPSSAYLGRHRPASARPALSVYIPGAASASRGAAPASPSPASPPSAASREAARNLGVDFGSLQQLQRKGGPSNGLLVRDPVGAQLVPARRANLRPASAPSGGASSSSSSSSSRTGAAAAGVRGLRTHSALAGIAEQEAGAAGNEGAGEAGRGGGGGGAAPVAATAAPTGGVVTHVGGEYITARRRHSALAAAREELWSSISGAAGLSLQPDAVAEPGAGVGLPSVAHAQALAQALRSPSHAAAAAGEAVYPRSASPESPRTGGRARHGPVAAAGARAALLSAAGVEAPAPVPAAAAAAGASPLTTPRAVVAAAVSSAAVSVAGAAAAAAAAAMAPGWQGTWVPPATSPKTGEAAADAEEALSEDEAAADRGAAAEAAGAEPARALVQQGSVVRRAFRARMHDLPDPSPAGPAADDDAPEDGEEAGGADSGGGGAGGAADAGGGSKHVQWGENVVTPRPRNALAGQASQQTLQAQASEGGGGSRPGSRKSMAVGGAAAASAPQPAPVATAPAALGRPPRYRAATAAAAGGESPAAAVAGTTAAGGAAGGEPAAASASAAAPLPHAPSRRRHRGRGGSDDLPSVDVVTAAGQLDRAARSSLEGGVGGPGAAAGAGPHAAARPSPPSHTDSAFYHLVAKVERPADVQGWVFNVYVTDILPNEATARRMLIASCTFADEHNHLLVPQPPPPPPQKPAGTSGDLPSADTGSEQQLAPPPQPQPPARGPVISPADLLPWVTRPEQLYGHWLRLEAFSLAPVADKVVDALTYMGSAHEETPAPPRLHKLQVVDVRASEGAGAGAGEHSLRRRRSSDTSFLGARVSVGGYSVGGGGLLAGRRSSDAQIALGGAGL